MIFSLPYGKHHSTLPPDGIGGIQDQNGCIEMVGQHVENVMDRRSAKAVQEPAPIDRAHLARYTSGDSQLELEVLALFAGQAGKCVGEMATARTQQEWLDSAHGLKGSARAVGAWDVANLATAAETIDVDSPIRRAAVLDALGIALSQTTRYITDLGGTGSPS